MISILLSVIFNTLSSNRGWDPAKKQPNLAKAWAFCLQSVSHCSLALLCLCMKHFFFSLQSQRKRNTKKSKQEQKANKPKNNQKSKQKKIKKTKNPLKPIAKMLKKICHLPAACCSVFLRSLSSSSLRFCVCLFGVFLIYFHFDKCTKIWPWHVKKCGHCIFNATSI